MRSSVLGIILMLALCIGCAAVIAGVVFGVISFQSSQPSAQPEINYNPNYPAQQNPNTINGLEASASDYQVFITYTPEPGAKVMRVEYVKQSSGSSDASSAFDFPISNDETVQATFQRTDTVYWGMRVTIIYDNNLIKFTEFQT